MKYEERFAEAESIYAAGKERVAATPAPDGQKFLQGTLVRIADNLGPSMSHFLSGRYAIVECSYAHAYPNFGGSPKEYSLLVQQDNGRWSSCSWYHESQLTEVIDAAQIAACIESIKGSGMDRNEKD